jgi:pilus assembly protein CpaF
MSFALEIFDEKGNRSIQTLTQFPCKVGRSKQNQIILAGWSVGKTHLEFTHIENTIRVIDSGSLSGTWINGRRIVDFGPLESSDEIVVSGYRLRLVPVEKTESNSMTQIREFERVLSPVAAIPLNRSRDLAIRKKLHKQLIQAIDLRRKDIRSLSDSQLRLELEELLQPLIDAEKLAPSGQERVELISQLLSEALGFGPLDSLLNDPTISEIMVNGIDQIFVERAGRLERCDASFSTDESVRHIIDRIVNPIGRRIDESSPLVDARLPDGSRVNAIISPLALKGSSLTIRKFGKQRFFPEDLVRMGSLTERMLCFLRICIEQRKNVIVSGGTGSGKTTLLNVMSSLIPEQERIVTIEDSAELRLDHQNWVALEARPANVEGRGAVSIRDLVKNSLRMRPDRIIVGEVRGGESLDMLQAMNTGHDGSLTTVHANSARDIFSRLEVMALMGGLDIPVQALREQISSAVDIVVHQSRFQDGSRRISSILEVTGIEAGRIQAQEIFLFKLDRAGATGAGRFFATGVVPSFYEELKLGGVLVNYDIFENTH